MGKPMQEPKAGHTGHIFAEPLGHARPAGLTHIHTIIIDTKLTRNNYYLLESTVPTITTHTFPAIS
jgi:hypothetical protein